MKIIGKMGEFLDSYRNRYLTLALLLTVSLILTAAFGYLQFQRTSYTQIDKISARAQTSMLLADVLAEINSMQKLLQDIVIDPDKHALRELAGQMNKLSLALEQLHEMAGPGVGEGSRGLIGEMRNDLVELQRSSNEIVSIRINDARWFPATSIMEDRLLPNFISSMTLLSEIAAELEEDFSVEASRDPLLLVYEIRMGWVRMTAELRLYIANRFGVFSANNETGMDARNDNIETYIATLGDDITRLQEYGAEGRLGLLGEEMLPELEANYQRWANAKDDLFDALTRDDWRMDLVVLRQDIYPIIERLQQRISSLQLDLDVQSASDITRLTDTARWLAFVLLAITGAIILITFAGYMSFNRLVLRPISKTTHALKKEASGESVNLSEITMLRETRELADAFHQMQRQVRNRQDRLDHLAHHDLLTQLPNRVLFNRRLEQAIQDANHSGQNVALMFLDLDRFKQINDTLGHGVGDLLLREVSMRLSEVISRDDATIARFGGDEFTIIVERIDDAQQVTDIAERILTAFSTKFLLGDHELHVSTSIGIALAPMDVLHASDLLRAADTAMYEAKQHGRNQYRFHSEEMSRLAENQMVMEKELRHAVERSEFEVHYQPIVSTRSKRLVGFESLLRWNHPEQGLLAPNSFLDVLEDSGLITAVTDWLLDQTVVMQEQLLQSGKKDIYLSINLTARLLNDDAFANAMEHRLKDGSLLPETLVIELTEDALTGYVDKADLFLRKVKKLGVRLALDDFGTGQSSLEHLRRFSFDIVKIDRSFVSDISRDPDDASLVDAVIKIGHSFDMTIVAEGVETAEQLNYIAERQCDYLQGYLISRPLPVDEALVFSGRYMPHLVGDKGV
jgi:diguanylate cyclase (GGDEF)-like protein